MKRSVLKRKLALILALAMVLTNPAYVQAAQAIKEAAPAVPAAQEVQAAPADDGAVFETDNVEEARVEELSGAEEALSQEDSEVQEDTALQGSDEAPASSGTLSFMPSIPERLNSSEATPDRGDEEEHLEILLEGTEKIKVDHEKSQASSASHDNGKTGLSITSTNSRIDRDYDQYLNIYVNNNSDQAKEFYLECMNPYDDIYMDFILNGSKEAPLVVYPGQRQKVELNVFAQNATRTEYSIAVTAHVKGIEDTITKTVSFRCKEADGEVQITETGEEDPVTLAKTYTVENTGHTSITDLTMTLDGDLEKSARISPGIENYELGIGKSVTFKVIPDIAKIKALGKGTPSGNMVSVSGNLVAEGGANASLPLEFSAVPDKVITTTMGQLGLELSGNPYKNLEFRNDTLSFNTAAGGKSQNFTEITARYYDESDSAKDGVNTAEELKEVLDTIFDDKGQIDFTIEDTLTYEDEGVIKEIPTKVGIRTLVVDKSEAGRDSADDEDTVVYVDEEGNLVTKTRFEMEYDEYKGFVENINAAKDAVSVEKWDDFLIPDGEGKEVVVEITNSIEGTALELPEKILKDPGTYLDVSSMSAREFNQTLAGYQRYVDSAFYTTYSTLGDAFSTITNVTDGVMMVADTARIWNNPNATAQQKVDYAGIQMTRAVVKYFGTELLSEGGVALGTAIADGPGAIVGLLLGNVVGAIIDYQLCKELEKIENGINGNANYFDIFGKQCTNVGSVSSVIYMPDGLPDYPDIYETGRMYDDNRTTYYVNRERVGYDYYINDHRVPGVRSENDGLTQITAVDLTPGNQYLHPGKNVIKRDYDTNPGTHFVTADSEITTIYPSDTPVSFVDDGSGELPVDEVRLLPDFSIYRENIVAENDAIAGEPNVIRLEIFNRGSKEGWVDVVLTDEYGRTIGTKEKLFLQAFSGDSVSFNWTPESVGEITLTCDLTNAGLIDPERKYDNNTASRVIEVRDRIVPVIESITPSELYADDKDTSVFATAIVSDIQDMDSVTMVVDGKELEDVKVTKVAADRAEVSGSFKAGDPGDKTISVNVAYMASPTQKKTVTAESVIRVKTHDEVRFYLDDTITDPKFYLVDTYATSIEVKRTASECLIRKNDAMQGNEDRTGILVLCKEGMIFKVLGTLDGSTLSLKDAKTVTISDNVATVTSIELYRFKVDMDGAKRSIYLNMRDAFTNPFKTEGFESVDIKVGYKALNSVRTTETITVDTTQGDAVVELGDYYRLYQIVVDGGGENSYGYRSAFLNKGEGDQFIYPEEITYDKESTTMKVLFVDSYEVKQIDEAADVFLYLGGDRELYRASLSSNTVPIHVSASDNRKLTISYNGTGECVVNQTSLKAGQLDISLYGPELSLPADVYDITVSYRENDKPKFHMEQVDLKDADRVVTLTGVMQKHGQITFNWSSVLGSVMTASCTYTDAEGTENNLVSSGIMNGETVPLPVGEYDLEMMIYTYSESGSYLGYYEFRRHVKLGEGDELAIDIGSSIKGSFVHANTYNPDTAYVTGNSIWYEVTSAEDVSGNTLDYVYRNTGINGEFILSDGENSYSREYNNNSLGSHFYGYIPDGVATGVYDTSLYISNKTSYYMVSTETSGSGSISPKSVRLKEGESQTFAITPDEGYHISGVFLDGKSVGAVSSYTVKDIAADHVLRAVFAEDKKDPDPSGEGGDEEQKKKEEEEVSENAAGKQAKLKQSGKNFVLEVGAKDVKLSLTVAKGNKFTIPGTKGSFTTSSKTYAAVNKKGVVKAKKDTGKSPVEIGFELYGKKVTLMLSIIDPVLSVSGNGIDIKKLKATAGSASKGGIVLAIPSAASYDQGASKIKGGITNVKVTAAGDDKYYITFKASGKGSAKLPFSVYGKKFTVKVKSK